MVCVPFSAGNLELNLALTVDDNKASGWVFGPNSQDDVALKKQNLQITLGDLASVGLRAEKPKVFSDN